MRTLIKTVEEKYQEVNVRGVDVSDKIAELRRKVALAREKTNRYVLTNEHTEIDSG